MNSEKRALVVGAGISGLACAWRLKQAGLDVRVLDAAERAGGVISTVARGGFLFESGPQSFQLTPELRQLISAVELGAELIEADSSATRYILVGGKLRPAPISPPQIFTGSLLSLGAKARVIAEALRSSKPPERDESIADFARRKFGTEILEHLAGPFVSGVFAGDPETLSLRSTFPTVAQWEREYGSVLRGAMKSRSTHARHSRATAQTNTVHHGAARQKPTLASFKLGMASLPNTIAERVGVVTARVESIARDSQGWKIRCESGGESAAYSCGVIVLAAPAYETARLLAPVLPSIATPLGAIPYAPVAVIAEGYRRESVGHPLRGFGYLIPRSEKMRTLGVVWNSSLFPGRAPEGMITLTSFAGGASDAELVTLDEGEIVNIVRTENGRVLGITGAPVEQQIWKHAKAIPQYTIGHSERVAAIRRELAKLPGIFLAGNYLGGPALGRCVGSAFEVADAAVAFVNTGYSAQK